MDSLLNKQNDPYDQNFDRNYQIAQKVLTILEEAGQQARLAGGCVRDRLLKIKPKDYDIATVAEPSLVCSIFEQKGIKTVPTGIDHGTITIVMGGQGIEVTSLRRDVSTDGRRAVVAFGNSFEEDSLRRDFTINALYEDRLGQIYDYHHGRKDLQNGILRFVGNPRTRIQEDYLRILRLFRFWARFGFEPQTEALLIIAEEARGLLQISQERKTSELMLILDCPDGSRVLKPMARTLVLEHVLGLKTLRDLSKATWDALYLHTKTQGQLPRLAALLMNFDNRVEQWASLDRLRLSKLQVSAVRVLLDPSLPADPSDPAAAYEWLDKVETQLWEGVWDELLLPAWTVLAASPELLIFDKTLKTHSHRRVCPLNGQYFIEHLKMKPGPELGLLLNDLKVTYRRGLWTTKEEALALVKTPAPPN